MLFFSLGRWQWRRLGEAEEYRRVFQARIAEPAFDLAHPPADPLDRRGWIQGTPDWDHLMWVAGKQMFLQSGYQLILPVKTGEATVLVDIGWVPQDEADAIVANERAVPGERRYEGLVRSFPKNQRSRAEFAEENGFQRLWAERDPPEMLAELGLPKADWLLVDGQGLAAEEEIRDRIPPVSGWRAEPYAPPHLHYAITWFSLFGLMFFLWLSLCFRKIAPPASIAEAGSSLGRNLHDSARPPLTGDDR